MVPHIYALIDNEISDVFIKLFNACKLIFNT